MSRFSTLPKDILTQLLHTIDDDNNKKIRELKNRLENTIEILESYKKLVRSMNIDITACSNCDKVFQQNATFNCVECGESFCLDCLVSKRICKYCYSSEESDKESDD